MPATLSLFYSMPNPVHSMLMAMVRYSSSSFLLEYMGKSMRLKHVWDLWAFEAATRSGGSTVARAAKSGGER